MENQLQTSAEKIHHLIQNMEQVIKGKQHEIECVLTCLLAQGHILLEDNPGTGKTVLARTLAGSIAGQDQHSALFKRVQFTPDLLPMDLLGSHIYDEETKTFVFRKGPLFCHVLLADEINRASPKVQSALLECMAEHQITVGETTYPLEKLFFTIATQNPIEMEGTYPLPAAQLDRFFMKIRFGYVNEESELEIYRNYLQISQNLNEIQQVLTLQDMLQLQDAVSSVHLHEEIIRAVLHVVRATRHHEGISLGASTRSGIIYLKCLRAYALIRGRDYVLEDDLADLCMPVLDHRLLYKNKDAKSGALKQILNKEVERLSRLKLFS